MGNSFFRFKQFVVNQENTAMKVGVDGVLLGAWANPGKAQSILDIGTGTGLLSLMLAQKSEAFITALEIEEGACRQAIENIRNSKWANRIEVKKSSIQDFARTNSEKFDFIICNPPYFNSSLNSPDEKRNLARQDRTLGLTEFLSCADKLLQKAGRFVIIYPYDRMEELISEAGVFKLFPERICLVKGNERKIPNRLMVEFGKNGQNCQKSEIVIRDSFTNEYTYAYISLVKEYYLNF
jgi:tRNA1Val (adenine37-N6)-methyltransferase